MAEGDYITKWTASQNGGLWGLGTNGANLYAVQDGREVNIYNKSGTYQSEVNTAIRTGDGFTTDGTSTWIGSGSNIYEELLSDGSDVDNWAHGLGGDGNPAGIDQDGTNIWVMNAASGEVRKFTMAGVYVSTFTLANEDQHWRMCIWDGYLYAPRISDGKLHKYDITDGSDIASWDLNVAQRDAYVRSMTTDGDSIWIGDYDNEEVFEYEGPGASSDVTVLPSALTLSTTEKEPTILIDFLSSALSLSTSILTPSLVIPNTRLPAALTLTSGLPAPTVVIGIVSTFTGSKLIGTGGVRTRFIDKNWPIEEGLVLGTTRQYGSPYLEEEGF